MSVSEESLPTLPARFFEGEVDILSRLPDRGREESFAGDLDGEPALSEILACGGSDCSVDGMAVFAVSSGVNFDGDRTGKL